MVSYDEEYENLIHLIFPSDLYPIVHDKLLHFQWKTTKHHTESFRQHCVDTARFMDKFCKEKNILQDTWKGVTYARLVGFLHDAGKPFVMKTTKRGYQLFTGHAQVGARLFYLRFQHEISEPILMTMSIAIDSHMCKLRSNKSHIVDTLRVNAVMHMYFPSLDILPILECLHSSDAMGKNPSVEDEKPAYLLSSPRPYRKLDKIVIFLIGPSGSGKTTIARKLESLLSSHGSVDHLERDKVLMEFAMEGETYQQCYRRVYDDPKLKSEFQLRWTQVLESAQSQILLIDTVKNYYHLQSNLFPHHFRIGLYCFPMNFVDSSLHGKAPKIEFPPQKWMGYPTVLTELKEGSWQLEVGTGVWQTIPTLVKRYLDQCVSLPLETQPTIANLWTPDYGSDAIKAQYNLTGITFTKQWSFSGYEIIRVSYLRDVTYGPTRYYRGEYLLKTGTNVSMLRSGLPTFNHKMGANNDFQKIVITPKYDGSLVNILYIPRQHKHFELLKAQFPDNDYPKYGLLFLGSKQALIMEQSIKKRFNKAIERDFEAFISDYSHYLKDSIMTLHFEMMVEEPHEELTVYYPKNFCKFIGCTSFTDSTRLFALPKPTDQRAVEQNEFHSWLDCEKYMEEQHQKLLTGDMFCEPEGFVLYVYDENGLKDIIKRKFVEYLAVNKPHGHPEEYERILSNPLLMNRFQKCRDVKDDCGKIHHLLQRMDKELTENWTNDRKTFSFYLEKNKCKFNDWQKELNKMTERLRLEPINLKGMLWKYFPNKNMSMDKILEPFKYFTS